MRSSYNKNLANNFSQLKNSSQTSDDNLLWLIKNQAYLEYKDYLTIKQYYVDNINVFHNLPAHRDQKFNHNHTYNHNTNNISTYHRLSYSDLYQIALLTAKCYYLQYQYQTTIHILQQILPLQPALLPFSFKFLYQRQLLLLKSRYLSNPRSMSSIQEVKNSYYKNKQNCLDWPQFTSHDMHSYYDSNFENIYKHIKIGSNTFTHIRTINNNSHLQFIQQLKAQLSKSTKIYEGIPLYLISKKWVQNFINFNHQQSNGNFFGPALNLELINHIFEFEIHTQESKSYMDILLFPVAQDIDYVVVSKKVWEKILNQFSGITIMRYPVLNGKFTERKMNDTLAKMILESNNKQFLLQWQVGTYWEKTVIPTLSQEFLGPGQLKQVMEKTNKNNQKYKQISIIKPGIVRQSKNRYKYIQFGQNIENNIPKIKLRKVKMKYDLQPYNMGNIEDQQQIITMNIIGIGKYTDTQNLYQIINNSVKDTLVPHLASDLKPLFKQYVFKLINTLNPIAHSLSSLYSLSYFYTTNTFIANLNEQYKSKNKKAKFNEENAFIQFTMAYADMVKKLWFSDKNIDSISNNLLVEEFMKQKLARESKMQQFNFALSDTITQIISYLHDDINQVQPISLTQLNSFPCKSPYFFSSLENLKLTCTKIYSKFNNSLINDLFSIHSYNMEVCGNCKTQLGYRFVPTYGLSINIPRSQIELLNVFFVYGNMEVNRQKHQSRGNIFDSQNEIIRQQISDIHLNRGNKVVQELNIQVLISNRLKDIYKLIQTHYSLQLNQCTNENQQQTSYQLITILIDENIDEWQKLGSNTTIKTVKQLLKKGDNMKKKLLFVFLVRKPKNDEEMVLVSFRNKSNNKNKGFPEIITCKKLEKSKSTANIQLVKDSLYHSGIQIDSLQFHTPKLKCSFSYADQSSISSQIYVYTQSRIGNKERTISKLSLSSPNTSPEFSSYSYNLEDLIFSQYCRENAEEDCKLDYESNEKNWENFKIVEGEKIMCRKCNNIGTEVLYKKLMECSKVVVISINRQSQSFNKDLIDSLKYPLENMNMKAFMKCQETFSIKKQEPLLYNLKALIFPLNGKPAHSFSQQNKFNSKNQPHNYASSKVCRYGCAVKNCVKEKWYLYNDEHVQETKVEQFIRYPVELLIYQKQGQFNLKSNGKNMRTIGEERF